MTTKRRAEKARFILSAAKLAHRRNNDVACWLFLLWLAEDVSAWLEQQERAAAQ